MQINALNRYIHTVLSASCLVSALTIITTMRRSSSENSSRLRRVGLDFVWRYVRSYTNPMHLISLRCVYLGSIDYGFKGIITMLLSQYKMTGSLDTLQFFDEFYIYSWVHGRPRLHKHLICSIITYALAISLRLLFGYPLGLQ